MSEQVAVGEIINANQRYESLLEQMLGQPLQAKDKQAGIQAAETR